MTQTVRPFDIGSRVWLRDINSEGKPRRRTMRIASVIERPGKCPAYRLRPAGNSKSGAGVLATHDELETAAQWLASGP